jgi:hypothetical protein
MTVGRLEKIEKEWREIFMKEAEEPTESEIKFFECYS